jgi:hypothetical protein
MEPAGDNQSAPYETRVVKSPVAINDCNTHEAGSFYQESAYSLLTIRRQKRFTW